jgi:hypothetical protein
MKKSTQRIITLSVNTAHLRSIIIIRVLRILSNSNRRRKRERSRRKTKARSLSKFRKVQMKPQTKLVI